MCGFLVFMHSVGAPDLTGTVTAFLQDPSAFDDDSGRQAHLAGQIDAALMAKAPDFLLQPPTIEPVDVLAANSNWPTVRRTPKYAMVAPRLGDAAEPAS